MSSRSRKVAEFALGSSLEMFVLILMAFVTAAVGEKQSCNEYCNSLKSAQLGNTGRSECHCHPQNAETESDKSRNLGNPIYYEPVEFHPLPDISFVYQPFVISNPTSSSDNKPTTRSLSSQETEHGRKYKRKDNVIHKISIDSSINPLYLDIDIKKSPDRIVSSQNYINKFEDLQIIEQDLKDCLDLHLLLHFRRNESDELKLKWNVENLEKYFHISDADLMMELDKRCKQPSDIMDQSLREIKERMTVIKPQYSNYSEIYNISDTNRKWNKSLEYAHDNVTRVNEPSNSISSEVPLMILENNLYNSIKKEERNRSNTNTFNNKYINNKGQRNPVQKKINKVNETLPSVIPILGLDKLAESDSNKPNRRNKASKYINDTQSIQNDIKNRAVFNNPKLEQDSVISELPEKTTETASAANLLTFFTLDNKEENGKNIDEDIIINDSDFLRRASATTIIAPQSTEDNNHSGKLRNIVNEVFSTTTRNYLANTAFVPLHESNLNNDLNIENASIRHDIMHTSTFKKENDNDLEHSSSNMEHVIIKNTENLPEMTTKYILSKPKGNPRSNDHLMVGADKNMYTDDPSPLQIKTHLKNDLTVENELTTPNSDSIYSDDNITLFTTTTEVIESNYISTYKNRTIIPENKLQIPRIFVTESSNETVNSIVDGTEEPNNDYSAITNFEMDVADLTSPKVKWIKDDLNSTKNSEHKEKLDIVPIIDKRYNFKEAGEGIETSNVSEISGNLYFMFKKLLIPMQFIQNPDGKLKLILDGASFCKNLTGANNNGILSILCNSAVHDKNNCTKTDKNKANQTLNY